MINVSKSVNFIALSYTLSPLVFLLSATSRGIAQNRSSLASSFHVADTTVACHNAQLYILYI